MLSKNHPMILFIDRYGFAVCQDTLTNIPKFSFTPDIVANLDVVNRSQFVNLIGSFIQINKMMPSSLVVILSDNVIYIKDLVVQSPKTVTTQGEKLDSPEDHKDEVQSFLEDIPFEEVLAKVVKTGSVNRVVAINKDLVMTIADVFRSKGFSVEGVVPSFMYGQKVNFVTGLNFENAKAVLEDTEVLRMSNLLTDQEKIVPVNHFENELKSASVNEEKKPQSLRQYILIGVFITLLVILAVVYMNMGVSQTPPPVRKTKASASIVAPTVIPTLSQSVAVTIPLDVKTLKVKITQSSLANEKAVSLKNNLFNIGLQDIISEISDTSVPEKSFVVFSQNIPADQRNNIILEIKKVIPEISTLEDPALNSVINIAIGKS